MAEAKEKSSTPPVPSDMQSILKRCENLEKEVRSLKLNLAFMNRSRRARSLSYGLIDTTYITWILMLGAHSHTTFLTKSFLDIWQKGFGADETD